MNPIGTPQVDRTGLDEAEAARRLRRDGPNELPAAASRGLGAIVLGVLREPMFLLLAAGCAIYLALGDRTEALVLLGSLLVVVGITAYQERKTERALEALRDLSSPRALVIRSGRRRRIPGREVVAGDLVLLGEGDRVPADGSVIDCEALAADESLLTGESLAVAKRAVQGQAVAMPMPMPGGTDTPFVYSGTLVVSGHATVRVQAIGRDSHIGRIGVALQSIAPEQTPLQAQTARAVRVFAAIGLSACALAVALHVHAGSGWLQALLAGITLAMAALPEEFPVVLTVFLALGAWRISRHKVLTRRMPAIETLGSATVLCVDKTGTLTQNRMAVAELAAGDRRHDAGGGPPPAAFGPLLQAAALACERDPYDPMEQAIVGYAQAHDADIAAARSGALVRDYELTRDLLAVTHCWQLPGETALRVAVKGAPEHVADLCRADAALRAWILAQTGHMASRGCRVLGVATGAWTGDGFPDSPRGFELEFLGLLGLADPVRPGVAQALRECDEAGIRVVMITGDYPGTALAIADAIGLRSPGGVLTGAELGALDAGALRARAARVNVFARVLPEQKLALVEALKADGQIVAMTGDGVNDAPALKAAHIGVAMGGRGTDVAREAASLVLLEDDFGSIVQAVRLGRRIYDNIRHAMSYLIAVHVPIAGMALLPLVFGWPPLLAPVHIVFLEFVIDPACAVAFEAEPEHPDTMRRPPRDPGQPLFGPRLLAQALLQGLLVLAVVAVLYHVAIASGYEAERARAVAFAALVLANAALILANRSRSRDPLQTLRMPNAALWWVIAGALAGLAAALGLAPLRAVFGFAAPGIADLALAALPALAVLAWATASRRLRTAIARSRV
ncbi:MAG TPA: HAD-IC family P-type ATPase [Burkholderiales bacterium]|nr:HAD-IC family P-type ATPase [Burkholderiales bacterium]